MNSLSNRLLVVGCILLSAVAILRFFVTPLHLVRADGCYDTESCNNAWSCPPCNNGLCGTEREGLSTNYKVLSGGTEYDWATETGQQVPCYRIRFCKKDGECPEDPVQKKCISNSAAHWTVVYSGENHAAIGECEKWVLISMKGVYAAAILRGDTHFCLLRSRNRGRHALSVTS